MVLKLTEHDFDEEVLKSELPVLVDFYADWCGPCKMMSPLVEQAAEEMEGRLKVGKVNVDENQNLAMQFRVMSIPMLIVFKGGKPVGSAIGLQSREGLKALIGRVL